MPHSINTLIITTMSDLDCPRKKGFKGKFKGLLSRLIADHPHDECPGGSGLEFITMPADDNLTRSRSIFTRVPQVMGEETSLVCLQCVNKFIGSYPLSSGILECNAAHNFTMRDPTFYVAQNVCPVITALMI